MSTIKDKELKRYRLLDILLVLSKVGYNTRILEGHSAKFRVKELNAEIEVTIKKIGD